MHGPYNNSSATALPAVNIHAEIKVTLSQKCCRGTVQTTVSHVCSHSNSYNWRSYVWSSLKDALNSSVFICHAHAMYGSAVLYMGIVTTEHLERSTPSRPSAVHIFMPRNVVKCGICYAKVCLSVPPSVTLVSHASTVQDIAICFAPHDRGTFLVSAD